MTGGDAPFLKEILDWLFELKQADGIGDRRAIFSRALGHLLLRQVKLINQALEGMRLLDGVEIFALEIFHQRHLQRDVSDYDWDTEQARALRCAPAAFAGDQLKAASNSADDERLNDATGMDGASKLVQRFFAEAGTRLVRAWINQVNIGLKQALRRCRSHRCCCCRHCRRTWWLRRWS